MKNFQIKPKIVILVVLVVFLSVGVFMFTLYKKQKNEQLSLNIRRESAQRSYDRMKSGIERDSISSCQACYYTGSLVGITFEQKPSEQQEVAKLESQVRFLRTCLSGKTECQKYVR